MIKLSTPYGKCKPRTSHSVNYKLSASLSSTLRLALWSTSVSVTLCLSSQLHTSFYIYKYIPTILIKPSVPTSPFSLSLSPKLPVSIYSIFILNKYKLLSDHHFPLQISFASFSQLVSESLSLHPQ